MKQDSYFGYYLKAVGLYFIIPSYFTFQPFCECLSVHESKFTECTCKCK